MVDARLHRDLSRRISLALGARIEDFRYDDGHKQELPNDLHVRRRVVPTLSMAVGL